MGWFVDWWIVRFDSHLPFFCIFSLMNNFIRQSTDWIWEEQLAGNSKSSNNGMNYQVPTCRVPKALK